MLNINIIIDDILYSKHTNYIINTPNMKYTLHLRYKSLKFNNNNNNNLILKFVILDKLERC